MLVADGAVPGTQIYYSYIHHTHAYVDVARGCYSYQIVPDRLDRRYCIMPSLLWAPSTLH